MTEPENKTEDEMTMEEALSAIRELISDDEKGPEGTSGDEQTSDQMAALSAELEDDALDDDLGEIEEEDALELDIEDEEPLSLDAEDLEPLSLEAEDVEPLSLEAEDVEPLELDAADVEPLELDETASIVEAEDDLAASIDDAVSDAAIEDIPKFLTELREALGEVEAANAAEDEFLPLSADLELHRSETESRGQQEPAADEDEVPPAIPDIIEEKVNTPMSTGEDRILSPDAAVKASSAFGNLSSLLTAGYEGEDNTLEGLVTAMLRPMLREWLDENLPRIVEEKVEAEIKRLSGN
ncbi:MAG: DUF2497 domain-containing protein [Alphaproteobacteria bacterium]